MAIVLDPVNGITQASWTTAGRPGSPTAGQVGFNTSLNALEQYTGSAWETIPTWTTSNRPVTPAAGYSGYNTDTKAFEFYNGTSWIGFNQSNLSVTASYLLVAGGAGGGGANGGGGGAGGLKTGTVTLNQNTTYFITVGGGGAGGPGSTPGTTGNGKTGSDSSLSGSGITTVTSTGGGYGGGGEAPGVAPNGWGGSGGSGGGGGGDISGGTTGGSGTPGQGNNGGSSPNSAPRPTGGGGGSGAAGSNGSGSTSGAGGTGTASSITGTSITYAGGGGGGGSPGGSTPGASGGAGGGGSGSNSTTGLAGLANTGSGGGGGAYVSPTAYAGGAGGSGVAIISYPGSQVFTGGTVTTSGGNTIHTFTTSAALLPTTNGSTFNNSLRFRSSASAYLSRTPSVTGNRTTFTFSFWIKRGALSAGDMFSANNAAGGGDAISFGGGSTASIFFGGGAGANIETTQVFRDPSAWYHIVYAVDTTQAVSNNRIKVYVNGNQVSAFAISTYPTQNYNVLYFNNSSYAQWIARGYSYLDGYMTNVNFIDGQALSPANFGTNNSNGVWVPIPYTGTYGTNGFFLNFGDGPFLTTSSNTGIGKDSSGNGNYWVTNNISVTTGSTFDLMTDVPTLTSATAANYAVFNPLSKAYQVSATLSGANLNISASRDTYGMGSIAIPTSGKWYWEFENTGGVVDTWVGLGTNTTSSINKTGVYKQGSTTYITKADGSGAFTPTSGITGGTGVYQVAYDVDNNKIWFGFNNTWVNSGDPAAGTNASNAQAGNTFSVSAYEMFILVGNASPGGSPTTTVGSLNHGQRPFAYTPPSGFVALNTYNLSTPTILQGNLYMDATLYNGTGSALTVVNQAGFKPDLVWIKVRSTTGDHGLIDSVRGNTKQLYSNLTAAEGTSSSTRDLTSFNSNGFSLGAPAQQFDNNANGSTYVGWQWQAGQGSTSSNTAGSITSTTSVSTAAGFSVITYSGTSANATIGHGLGVAPKMIIVKSRTTAGNEWCVWHTSLTNATYYLYLNATSAQAVDTTFWNSTAPTSTLISLGGNTRTNGSGQNYVCYAWAEIAGFSKFGSYTGNGSADGVFVYLGFLPKYIMIKRTDTTANWIVMDTGRGLYNASYYYLDPNLTDADSGPVAVDFLSNGFKMRLSNAPFNASGGTYIYAAFAENPFKYANAR